MAKIRGVRLIFLSLYFKNSCALFWSPFYHCHYITLTYLPRKVYNYTFILAFMFEQIQQSLKHLYFIMFESLSFALCMFVEVGMI